MHREKEETHTARVTMSFPFGSLKKKRTHQRNEWKNRPNEWPKQHSISTSVRQQQCARFVGISARNCCLFRDFTCSMNKILCVTINEALDKNFSFFSCVVYRTLFFVVAINQYEQQQQNQLMDTQINCSWSQIIEFRVIQYLEHPFHFI